MGSWKPIFDGDDFDRRASKIADPARKHKRASRKYLLRGIIRNEQGENLIGRDTATRPATYVTPQYAEGEWVGILSDRVEAVVIEAVLQRFEKTPKPKAKKVGSATGSAAADIEKELLDLAQLRAANKISLDEWIIVRDGIQARLAEAQKLAPIAAAPVYPATPAALRDAWPSLSFDQQRQVVVDSVESVVVCRSEKPRWTAVDDRITINWRVD